MNTRKQPTGANAPDVLACIVPCGVKPDNTTVTLLFPPPDEPAGPLPEEEDEPPMLNRIEPDVPPKASCDVVEPKEAPDPNTSGLKMVRTCPDSGNIRLSDMLSP